MESANFHHHQQLQDDQLVDSPPLSSPSCYGAATTLSWPQNTNICLSTRDTFNPNIDNYGAIVNSRDPNSPMIQDLGFHWTNCTNSTAGGSFTGSNRSPHDLQLEIIKEEFSETYPKLTEMISSPTSCIEDLHLHPSSYIKNNQQQRDPHNLSANMRSTISNDKLLVRNFSSGCKINGLNQLPGGEFMIYPNSTNPQNCSGRGTFSQIFPTVNISDLNQSSNLPISSSSLDINLPALNLFRSARFNGSFIHPSSTDNSHLDGIFKDSTTSIPYGLDHMQQISHRPTNSPSKISASFNSGGGAEAKRPSNYMEETKAPQSTATKKSRLESRSSCPPFKVRKEKLGDRISALQQLVAPFGKTSNGQLPRLSPGTIMNTVQLRCEQDCQERINRYITQILQTDTASVLMEAIGYIKFLQNQVETLSVPYMKSSHTKTGRMIHLGSMEDGKEEPKRDLRSRGLCLVPLPCLTYVTDGSGGVWSPPNFTN